MDDNKYLKMARELHNCRTQGRLIRKELDEKLEAAHNAVLSSEEGEVMSAQIAGYQTAISKMEEELREGAADWYITTGQKEWLNGIGGTQVYTTLQYEPTEMVDWAIEHGHPDLLKLDVDKFAKTAQAVEIEGVRTIKDAKSFVASDLSKVLEV